MSKITTSFKIVLLTFGVTLGANQCDIDDNFLKDRESGWFWGEVCIDEPSYEENSSVKQQYAFLPKKVEIPWEILDKIDPDDIAELENISKKIAILYPTQENIKEYKLLQKWISDKSFAFMSANMLVAKSDTDISKWVAQTPVGSRLALTQARIDRKKGIEKSIKQYKDSVAIVVMSDKNCPYCQEQIPILREFQELYGIKYIVKEIDVIPNAVRKLGVSALPDMFLVFNENNKPVFQRLASGLQPLSTLEIAFLMALDAIGKLDKEKERLIYGRS